MKLICFCATFLLLSLFSALETRAQEAGMSDSELTLDVTSAEEGYTVAGEVRFIPQTPGYVTAKDSLMLQISDFPMQRAAQRPPQDRSNEKQKAKDDDSILTFNFLYYIIQKYKLQDIID
jgi:hypothetical protein